MTALAAQPWLPDHSARYVRDLATAVADATADASATGSASRLLAELDMLVERNRQIHDRDCVNLNPATNIMNPRAEAMLSAGLGSRPSLGYPGDKYEMGLEAIEQIEVMAAELAAEVFEARYAEVRVPSGAIANLYSFMATCEPGDTIIAPPACIGGHVTHHGGGSAGMYRLRTIPAPVTADRFTVDVDAVRTLAREHRPRMITIGASLNLYPHPVSALREIADEVGAILLFDAAHLCGLIAGGVWPNPLEQGAHLMTMSTYKSLGGPPGGLIVTNDADLARTPGRHRLPGPDRQLRRRQDRGAGRDDARLEGGRHGVREHDGRDRCGTRGPACWARPAGLPGADGPTRSHQFAVEAYAWGGGQHAARSCGVPTCWPAASDYRRHQSRQTSTGCASAPPNSSGSA